MAAVAESAASRGARFLYCLPRAGAEEFPSTYEATPGAMFGIVADDPDFDRDASEGPAAFDADVLGQLFDDALVVVMSGGLDEGPGALIATMLAVAPKARLTLVITNPRFHAAWTNRVHELSGMWPILHVAVAGMTPADVGVPASSSAETLH